MSECPRSKQLLECKSDSNWNKQKSAEAIVLVECLNQEGLNVRIAIELRRFLRSG